MQRFAIADPLPVAIRASAASTKRGGSMFQLMTEKRDIQKSTRSCAHATARDLTNIRNVPIRHSTATADPPATRRIHRSLSFRSGFVLFDKLIQVVRALLQ